MNRSSAPFEVLSSGPTVRRTVPLACTVLVLAALGAGCAVTPSPDTGSGEVSPATDFPRSRLVALDFVDAMVQLPELEPARTTLYTDRPDSRFGELLVGALQSKGYDLRLGVDGVPATLGYRVESGAGEGAAPDDTLYTFLVEAGSVRLKRSYRVDLAGVQPASPMRLHGANGHALASSPSRFESASRPVAVTTRAIPRRVEPPLRPVSSPGALPASSPPPSPLASAPSSLPSSSPARPERRLASLPPRSTGARPAEDRARTATRQKRNLFETGRSNYAELLARYETLSREVMVFPNDSLRMGAANKRRAVALAALFDPARDVISVLGCSHGSTAIDNGNEVLANGRALRVKEELLLAGIAGEQVLEEGCWAGSAHGKLPGRGVVVTHKRLAGG